MARLFATSINLNKNELQNARIQNLSSNPSSPVAGQIYFNTTDNELKFYDGTAWISGGSVKFGNTASRPAASKAGTLYIDTQTTTLYVDNGTSWVQGTVTPEDVAGWISDHNDLTTGVHGVTGDVVGTSDTQTLSNKTISDNLHFNAGSGSAGYIHDAGEGVLEVHGNTVDIYAENNVNIISGSGDIILDSDGAAYLYNNSNPDNRLATIGDLNSDAVVQSVSGTVAEINASTLNGDVTLSLPDSVSIHDGLTVGENATDETFSNGYINVKKLDGSNSFSANEDGATVNGDLVIQDGNGNQKLAITHSYTGTTRITTSDDLALRSNDGDIILYPGNDNGGTGKAYVHWGNDATGANPENEITTAGNTQIITNKTVEGPLNFKNPSTSPTDGEIFVDDISEEFVVRSYTADLVLNSQNGDILLTPDGKVRIDSALDVNGNLNTTTIAGSTVNSADGSLTLQNGNAESQIHINGTSKNIELLPTSGSKAFYGSAATAGNEIAKISDLQALSSGLNWKTAVNLLYNDPTPTLSGDSITTPLIIDGHSALGSEDVGYRILVTQGDDAGIYVYNQDGTSWTLDRATDADAYTEIVGAAVFVMEGTQYGSTSWVQSNHYLEDFTGQDWIQFSGQGTYIGSNTIQIDGREISVIADSGRAIGQDESGLYLKIGNGLNLDGTDSVALNAGTGFTTSSGPLEFASGYGVRKYATSIGTNTATSADVVHNFDTKDVTVTVFDNATDEEIFADVKHYANKVTISCSTTITTNQYRVVVIG